LVDLFELYDDARTGKPFFFLFLFLNLLMFTEIDSDTWNG